MAAITDPTLLCGIADGLPAMIGYWDTDLRNQFANAAYHEYFGWDPQQLRGVHISELPGPDLFEQNLPYMNRALQGEGQTFDRTLVDIDGKARHTQASYIPHRDNGEVVGFFVLVADITEQVETARKLAESQERFRILSDISELLLSESGKDPQAIAATAVSRLTALMGDVCVVTLLNNSGDSLVPVAFDHSDP